MITAETARKLVKTNEAYNTALEEIEKLVKEAAAKGLTHCEYSYKNVLVLRNTITERLVELGYSIAYRGISEISISWRKLK